MAFLRLHLLGAPQIERDDRPVHFERRRALALGIYLAVTGQIHSRDALTALFWPEASQGEGRANLRRMLSTLTHTLGQEAIRTTVDQVSFARDDNLWLDVEHFRRLIAACHSHGHPVDEVCPACLPLLTAAADLYRDDFLAGFTLPDSPGFDDWQFFQGEQLRTEMALVLELLTRGYADQGHYLQAMVYAQRRLVLDPLNEPAHRWLIQLYGWTDQPAAAERQYTLCQRLLARELGVPPDAETTALHQTIRERRLPLPARAPIIDLTPAPASPPHQDDIRVLTVVSIGLTDSAESADPAQQADAMHHLLSIVQQAAQPYGGQVERVVGEDILVIFGREQVQEDDAERAVRLALALIPQVDAVGISLQIGIQTGMAYCRHGDPATVTVMGAVVNLATRLRHRAAPGQILVGRTTYLTTRGLCDYRALAVTLPGLAEPVPVYAAVHLRTHPLKVRGVEGRQAALVGRLAEMVQLHGALAQAVAGEGQIVTIAGAAGIGKSRLVAELKAYSGVAGGEGRVARGESQASMLWLEGRGSAFAMGISNWLFVDLLRGYFSKQADENEAAIAQQVTATLAELVGQGQLTPDRRDEIEPLLHRLLAVRSPSDQVQPQPTLDPKQVRRRTAVAVQTLLVALAQAQPVGLVFEDLQWADALSLELIGALLTVLPGHALLLLCLYRPEEAQLAEPLRTFAQQHCPQRLTALDLEPLTQAESRQLVADLLALPDLPAPLQALTTDRTRGNPFFLEESVRALLDSGVIYQHEGAWQVRGAGLPAVPPTLQSIILSRTDRLTAPQRTVLEMAAVMGRFFRPRLLARMAGPTLDLATTLAALTTHAFIYQERTMPEAEYTFYHVLVRDAVYQALPAARRRALHQGAAEALEQLHAANLEPAIEQLAYHYDESRSQAKAIYYLLEAGRKAHRTYANAEALAYFHRAEDYLAQTGTGEMDPQQRLAMLDGISQVYATTGNLQQGEPYFQQALALAKAAALPPVDQVQRIFPFCHLLAWHGRHARVLALADEGLALLADDLTRPEALMLAALKSDIYFNRGQHHTAMVLIAQIVELLPELPYTRRLLATYNMVAMWSRYTKQIELGFDLLLGIEQKALAQADHWLVGYLHGWPVMFLYETIGDLKAVFASLEKVEQMATQTGDELLKIQAYTYRGIAHGWCCGEWAAAAAYAQETIRLTERADVPRKSAFAYIVLGLAHYCRQAWQDAITTLETARQIALATDFRADGPRRGDIGLAWSYLQVGRQAEAAALFRSVVVEEEADIESLHLITCALAGLAAAAPDPVYFQEECQQIAAERGGSKALPLLQWQPKPAQPAWRVAGEEWRVVDTDWQRLAEGWEWHDPFGDCSYTVDDNGLMIRAANYRDLWLNNFSAPRLLRPLYGPFALEASCTTAAADRPAMGGLLLWQDQANYLRLTWNTHGPGEINLLGCLDNRDLLLGRGTVADAQQVYLRFERIGRHVCALYSSDGATWYSVGDVAFAGADPLLAGPLAIGMIHRYVHAGGFTEGTAIRFASLTVEQLPATGGCLYAE
ncbi:MAG: hypothetical protein DYG89_12880 [Caldilinea sp. CFX5]|nr:hypothetical protein [Caldilinea sp. CFX5]